MKDDKYKTVRPGIRILPNGQPIIRSMRYEKSGQGGPAKKKSDIRSSEFKNRGKESGAIGVDRKVKPEVPNE